VGHRLFYVAAQFFVQLVFNALLVDESPQAPDEIGEPPH
jgi:hypothetical protein